MAAIHVNGPGKTAPKLLADFLQFDPQKNVGGNILTSNPPLVGEGQTPTPHRDACKHEYAVKASQSVAPPLDARPDASSRYKLAVVCKRCRLHVDIRINYQQATDPCPTSESKLHHFQRADGLDETGTAHIRYGWQCSSPSCQALLTTTFKLPKIGAAERNLLTDTSKLKSRFEAVIQQEPEREGIRQATPVDALTRLRRYIKDALKPEHDKRVFPGNNKRFMEAYGIHGRDCRDLLESLGFKYNVRVSECHMEGAGAGANETQEEDGTWALPNPPLIEDRVSANGSSLREQLEDVEMELLALTWRTAAEMNVVNPVAGEGWPSAQRDLERTLASHGYLRYPSVRRANGPNELDSYYASLGAISDFADSLIEFAYDRQTQCDALREPYYYECIQAIAKQRSSEELQIKTTMLESKGLVSRRDLSEAYRYFNLPADGGGADEDRIFNLFQAQHTDSGAQAQERAREMLGRIGRQRGSKLLMNAAMQTIETAQEAYAWLGNGLGPDTDDSFVVTIFSLRTDGNKDLEEIGRKAVSIIARERKSNYLNNWLAGDETTVTTMNVDEALRLLGVDAALETVDGTLWPQIFAGARDAKPSEQTEQAISAVQKALAVPTAAGRNAAHPPETWPVGLVSHGNTCYLNSLLQYYFSLKPLRGIVSDYGHYKLDTTESKEKLERVGQRRVSMQEIQGGQKFADELRHLFERMVKDRGPAVKPEQDLVCRAFLDPKDFAQLEEQRKTSETAIDDSAVHTDTLPNGTEEKKESGADQSRASSETLQADENPPINDVDMKGSEMPPTPPASPGQKPADDSAPPPLPARRFSTTTSDTLRQAQAKATQQQDVTEVHDSITQRLRAGMRPTGADNRGEQNDALRDLFAIGMSQTTLSEGSSSKPERISDSSIQLNVPTEPTTLYSALDEYFDPQVVTEGSEKQQYRSIVELPPLIQINMPRIGFSKEKGAFKSEAALRLEDELYLDRYYEEGVETGVLDRRRSAWGWRRELLELKKEQKALTSTKIGVDGPTAVQETAKYLQELDEVNKELWALGEEEIDNDASLHTALKADAAFQTQRVSALGAEVQKLSDKLTGTFDDLKEKKYRLYAVFFHRGGPSSGHYWVSIHDFKNDIWRNYNDESVTEVPSSQLQEIFYADKWQHGTPTFAVYVRDDLKDNYVQAVCREPEPEAEEPMPDLEMLDAPPANGTVDPSKLVKEGGGSTWDEERQVPDVKWGQVPDLIIVDPDSDKRPNSFDEGSVEIITDRAPDFQNLYDAKAASLAKMAKGSSFQPQPAVSVAELGVLPEYEEDLTLRPMTPEKKRVASKGTGGESPSKKHIRLPGIGKLNLLPRREK